MINDCPSLTTPCFHPHSFLNQKPWHPMNFRNQARVWEAEQAKYEEEKKKAEAKVHWWTLQSGLKYSL